MSSGKKKYSAEKKLRLMRENPKARVRVMQINSAISVSFVPSTTTGNGVTQSATQAADPEQPTLQITSPTFTSLVQEAKSYPEVRSEVVAAYTAQVASGHYPPVDVISGLADLLSGTASN
jgi:hypothetical protein